MIRRLCLCLLAVLVVAIAVPVSALADQAQPALMPLPAQMTPGSGQLVIDNSFTAELTGYTEPRLVLARTRFLRILSRETGIPIPTVASTGPAKLTIKTGASSAPVQKLEEDESYHLEITSTGATLTAPNPLGVLHGLQTLLQLVHVTPQASSTGN